MVILLLAVGLLLLNAVASVRVWHRPQVPQQQRAAQLLVVWLLPVVGALLCMLFVAMTRIEEERHNASGMDCVNDSGYAGDEFGHDGGRCVESGDSGGDGGGGD